MSPQVRLYFGIISISFFPIVFYFFSIKAPPFLVVFLLFSMVFLLSLPAMVGAMVGEIRTERDYTGVVDEIRGGFSHLVKVLTPRVLGFLLLISLIAIAGNLLVVHALSHQLSPSVAQSLLRSETVFVSLGGILIFKESYPRSLPWVIVLILIAFTIMGYEFLMREWTWDNIYFIHVLLASLCFGLFQIISKFIIHDLNIYLLNGVRSLIGSLLLLPWVYPYFSEITGEILLWGFLSALVGPFLGRNVILSCTRDLPLNYIGCNLSLTPIFSLGLQWLFLHNLPSSYELVGGGMIIFSVLLFNLSGKKQ